MKIKSTVTEEREIEIPLPFFRKNKSAYVPDTTRDYIALLPDETVACLYISNTYTSVVHAPLEFKRSDVIRAFNEWVEISEEEFLSAHAEALKSLSLVPELANDIPSNLFNGERDADYPLLNMPD